MGSDSKFSLTPSPESAWSLSTNLRPLSACRPRLVTKTVDSLPTVSEPDGSLLVPTTSGVTPRLEKRSNPPPTGWTPRLRDFKSLLWPHGEELFRMMVPSVTLLPSLRASTRVRNSPQDGTNPDSPSNT